MKLPIRALAALALVSIAIDGNTHPNHESDALRLAVYEFATALVNDDVATVARKLSADGRFFGADRDAYLAGLTNGVDISNVLIDEATYEPVDGGIRVAPLVVWVDRGAFQLAWAATLAQGEGEWHVVALGPASAFPDVLVTKGLPEHQVTVPVAFSLVDAKSGKPVYARVHIVDGNGEYWPPRGHQKHIRLGWREDVGGDVHIAGKTYAYVAPDFVADLPAGDFKITAVKGTEYDPATLAFSVGPVHEQAPPHRIAVKRWADTNAEGWYSGDTHVHFLDDHSALLELQAEDLNVINVLATKWGELITNANQVTGAPSRVSTPDGIVYFNEETRHGWLGHTILHRLKELVYPLSWGGPGEGVRGGFDFPPMAYQADRAHAQGGMVTWAHFPFPGGELAVDVALGKIDSVDLFTWGDAFADLPSPAGGTVPGAVSLWYTFLNAGFTLPATAGTDKMLNVQVAGSVRTYAHLDGAFSYDGWLDAIRAGRTFVTTGPQLRFSANGKPIGDTLLLAPGDEIELEAEVVAPFDRYPVDTLEIVLNGDVIAQVHNADGRSRLRVTHSIRAEQSAWLAARARGSRMLPYQVWPRLGPAGNGVPPMAHTSPIYTSVAGKPIRSAEDADVLAASVQRAIDWAKSQAKFQHDGERAEMVALFEKAKRVYEEQR